MTLDDTQFRSDPHPSPFNIQPVLVLEGVNCLSLTASRRGRSMLQTPLLYSGVIASVAVASFTAPTIRQAMEP